MGLKVVQEEGVPDPPPDDNGVTEAHEVGDRVPPSTVLGLGLALLATVAVYTREPVYVRVEEELFAGVEVGDGDDVDENEARDGVELEEDVMEGQAVVLPVPATKSVADAKPTVGDIEVVWLWMLV